MTSIVRRAGAVAALCTLSLAVPLFGPLWATPIAAGVGLAALVIREGPLFDLFAYPDDYEDGRLYGLLTFVLAATALGFITAMSSMPIPTFVGAIVLVGYGAVAEAFARTRTEDPVIRMTAFCLGATAAAIAGQAISHWLLGTTVVSVLPTAIVLAASGALLAAILRDVLLLSDDPIIILTVGIVLWLLAELEPAPGIGELAVALVVTAALGYVSYRLETASVTGMLTGVLLGLLTIVLGGYAWFVVLIAFFAIGGLSTKFRYEQKATRGVAEDNDGARGGSNVLGNAAVALGAVIAYAASVATLVPIAPIVFLFAFAGSIATAMSDTLSSELGGVFDQPRLITTFEPVQPGTDGAITWQGELAGIAGAAIIAVLSGVLFQAVTATGTVIVLVAGVVGMTVDSLLGATVEGTALGNQGVNFLATLSGAVVGALLILLTMS